MNLTQEQEFKFRLRYEQEQQQQPTPTQLPNPNTDQGLVGRSVDTGLDAIGDAYKEYGKGWQQGNPIEGAIQGGGKIVGGIGDIAGDAIGSAYKAVGSPLKEEATQAIDYLSNTAPVKSGIELMKSAGQAYDDFKQENPELGKTTDALGRHIEASTAIGTLMAPTPGKVTTRTNVWSGLNKANKEALKNTRKSKVLQMIEPENKKGAGNLNVDAHGNHIYEHSPWEMEVADEIVKVPDLKTSAPLAKNHNVLRREATKLREQMEAKIKKAGNPEIDMDALDKKLEYITENLNDMEGGFALVGNSEDQARNLLVELRKILKKSDGTAIGVMEARREFDHKVRNAFGDVYNADRETAKSIANRWIRDTLNETVNDSVSGVNVLNSLQRQHKLLYAADDLLGKAYKERDTVIGRLVQNTENALGIKLPTTPLALGATGAAGVGLVAGAPAAAGAAAAIAGLYAGYKGATWLGTAAGRQWMIRVVKAIEKDPLLLQSLKTDRLALLGMLEQTKDEEE